MQGKVQAQPLSPQTLIELRAFMPVVPVLKANYLVQRSLGTHLLVAELNSDIQRTRAHRVRNKEQDSIFYSTVRKLFLEKSIISNCKQLLIALLIIKKKLFE